MKWSAVSSAASEEVAWAGLIPPHDWALYRTVLDAALARQIPFALGGGFAFSTYARRWRDTKDMDLYILPRDRPAMVELVTRAGFEDYFPQASYDRSWIYRGYRDGVICDLIWQMANGRAEADPRWMTAGREIHLHGLALRVLPIEELLWTKLYVLQRDRCDWPDLLNLLFTEGPTLDWQHLLDRAGDDAPVLGGLLAVFTWMCPGRARELPAWIWPRLGIVPPPPAGRDPGQEPEADPRRVAFLDSRDWFGPRPLARPGDLHAHRRHEPPAA